MENSPSSSSRTDRKTIERNRRNQMKALYSMLNSLVPHQPSKEITSLPDQIDEAASYIKKLQVNLERMKEKKDRLRGNHEKPNTFKTSPAGRKPAKIEIGEMGSALEVVLITGLDRQFMFTQIIRMLHEEGAEVVHATFSTVDDSVFHTIHSKVGESAPVGHAAARISERLRKFVHDSNAF